MSTASTTHPGELKLRALLAGETVAEELRSHANGCDDCRTRLKGFEEEQARFEAEIPFERFAAGVERAARTPRQVPVARPWLRAGLALAAALAVTAGVGLVTGKDAGWNRPKGGGVVVKIASALGSPQRTGLEDAKTPDVLAPGERIRLGLKADEWRYALVASVDERGEVTPIYPEAGTSFPLSAGHDVEYLPDSVEFTGRGLERVVIVMSLEPLAVDDVVKALRAGYEQAHGNVLEMKKLDVPGEQFERTFLKP